MKDYQTLFVGVVGFAGVIITLLVNAWQARKQRRDERTHECETMRTALIEELAINRGGLQRNAAILNDGSGTSDVSVPTDPMNDVYEAFTHRIGLLSKEEVKHIMYAYLTLRTYGAKLLVIGVPTDAKARNVKVPAKNLPVLTQMKKDIIQVIDAAIDVMQRAQNTR